MSRVWKISLAGLGSALLIILLAFYWLLHTASGAAWLWHQAEDLATGAVRSSQIEGDLYSGFIVREFKYFSDAVEVSVGRAEIQVGPGWWPVSVQIRVLTLQDVEIVTRSLEDQPDPDRQLGQYSELGKRRVETVGDNYIEKPDGDAARLGLGTTVNEAKHDDGSAPPVRVDEFRQP